MKNDFFRRLVMGRIGLLLLFLISTMYVQAQGVKNVSGMIKDASGDPLIGVNVTVKGDATLGTISDMDGEYSLKIPREKVTMVFSFIGYKTLEKSIDANTTKLDISLSEDTE